VAAGTYFENPVMNKDELTLVGESVVTTIIDGGGVGNSVTIAADNCTIAGFTIRNSGGTYPESGVFLNNVYECLVLNCNVSNNNGHGIFVIWGSSNSILSNLITHNAQPGIRIDGTSAHTRVVNNTIKFNQPDGIFLYVAYDVLIQNNTISNNEKCGITPQGGSKNVTIRHNIITDNGWNGIFFYASNSSIIEENTIARNGFGGPSDWKLAGIDLHDFSNSNVVVGNALKDNKYGISIVASSYNKIYHNNFYNDIHQANVEDTWLSPSLNNVWDDGYPSGGNHWSDRNGVDLYSGPYQNETGSDGIRDTSYVIYVNNRDKYPLTKLYGGPSDIGITTLITSKTAVGQDFCLNVSAKIINYGVEAETFNVTTYANTTPIGTFLNITLANRNSTTLTFLWNTTGVAKGNYTIKAYAWPVPDEIDTTDNTYIDGWVTVAMPGDITSPEGIPDGKVDMRDDYLVARGFGAEHVTDPNDPRYCQYWHKTPCGSCPHTPNADTNNDGKIDMRDIYVVARNFGKTDP